MDVAYRLDAKSDKHRNQEKAESKGISISGNNEKEAESLWTHICRMENSRKIRGVMMGMMKGTGKKGRPHREWLDDIKERCQEDIHYLSQRTQDRERLSFVRKCVFVT